MISNKMMSNLNMLSAWMLNKMFGNVDGTSVVTKYKNIIHGNTKIIQLLFYPYNLCTTTTSSNIFSFSSRKSNRVLLFTIPKNKHMIKELTCSTSVFPTRFTTNIINIKKLISSKNDFLGYHKPKFCVPIRYLKIRLSAIKWDSLRHAWNLAHKKTLNIILGILAIK